MLGTFEDISVRKRAERMLTEAEAKYRCLVEESLVGVYLIQQGRFAYVNDRLATIFGYHRDELIGLPIEQAAVPEDRALVVEDPRLDPGVAAVQRVQHLGQRAALLCLLPIAGERSGPLYRLSVRTRMDLSEKIPFWTRFQEYYFSSDEGSWKIFAIF